MRLTKLPAACRRVCLVAAFLAMMTADPANSVAAIHGTFLPTAVNLSPTVSSPDGVAVADIDGDGWNDVVASGLNVGGAIDKVLWYRNNGDGSFASVQHTVTSNVTTNFFTNVAVGDLNLDGRPDVVYWLGSEIRWSPNLGGSNPTAQFGYQSASETANQFVVTGGVSTTTRVALADINGDARLDVLYLSANPSPAVGWVPNLVGGFGSKVVVSTAGGDPTSVQGVDLDQDGLRDLLVTSSPDNTVAWFKNLGGGSFGSRQIISNAVNFARSAAAGDINGDGLVDVVAGGTPDATTTVRWFAQNAIGVSPRFSPVANDVTQVTRGCSSVLLRDVDSDGKPDIVALGPTSVSVSSGTVFWCENLGAGNFGALTTNQRVLGSANLGREVAAGDLDQNGTVDFVANSFQSAGLIVYRNLGGQTALATADTAPGTLMEGRRDDVLRIAVSHKGIAGDSAAQLDVLKLRLENGSGVALTTPQANALLDKVAVHLDADGSGVFDPAFDPAVATVTELVLTNGVLNFPFAGSNLADIQIAQGATRTYFIVVKMAAAATAQSPSSVRGVHFSSGLVRSAFKDAASGAPLSSEVAGTANVTSSLVSASAQNYTYTDWSYISYDAAGVPGTGALETPRFDGISNLIKFGLAIDGQATNAPAGLPVMVRQSGNSIFRHLKPAITNGLTYAYDISRTLGAWQPAVENVDYVRQDTALPAGLIQRDLTVLGPWQKTFLRVRLVLAN